MDLSAIRFPPLLFREITLYDENYAPASNLEVVLQQLLEVMKAKNEDKKHLLHAFEGPNVPRPQRYRAVSYIKVASVSVNVENQTKRLPIRFDMSKFLHFVRHDVASGKDKLVVEK